jgi:hypothetical protein
MVVIVVVVVVVGAIVGENQRFQIPGFAAGEGSASTPPRARTGQPDAADVGGGGMVSSMLAAIIIFHRVVWGKREREFLLNFGAALACSWGNHTYHTSLDSLLGCT